MKPLIESDINTDELINEAHQIAAMVLDTRANKLDEAVRVAKLIRKMCKYDTLPRMVWDYEGRILCVNQLFADMLGYDRSELIGKNFEQYIHPESLKESLDVFNENIMSEEPVVDNFENRYLHKDGRVVRLLWKKIWNDPEIRMGSGQVELLKP